MENSIIESNHTKRKVCENCKNRLKGILSEEKEKIKNDRKS